MAEHTLFPSILPDGEDAVAAVADEISLEAAEAAIASDDCPFCESYEGTHPTNHAPKAHPNRWEAYKQARTAETAPATEDAQTSADSALTDGGE